jgi:hypothetical protein
MESFAQWFATSSFLTATLGEYGVTGGSYGGSGSMGKSLTSPSHLDDGQLKTDLDTAISGGQIPDVPSAVYVVTIPPGVQVQWNRFGPLLSCSAFLTYHDFTAAKHVYAVVPDCPGAVNGLTDADEKTVGASHEVSEATTDPYGDAFIANNLPFGAEIGDLCEGRTTSAGGFRVQREFSNKSAAAGSNPCLPADPSLPYFGVGPVSETVLTVPSSGSSTLDALVFSDMPLGGAVSIQVVPFGPVGVTVSSTSAAPGEHVTITVTGKGQPGDAYGFELLGLNSAYSDYSSWPVQVQVQ